AHNTPQCFPLRPRVLRAVHIARRVGWYCRSFPLRSPGMGQSSNRGRYCFLWPCSPRLASCSLLAARHSISARSAARQVPLSLSWTGVRLWLDALRWACAGSNADDGRGPRFSVAGHLAVGGLLCWLCSAVHFRGSQPEPISYIVSEIAAALAMD